MKKHLVFVLAVFLILFCSLSSCAEEERSAAELLSDIMEKSVGLPHGKIYLKNARVGEEEFLSEALAVSMYGEACTEVLLACEDIAVYLSNREPYEIAVFKCYSSDDAQRIAAICMKRLDTLRTALRYTEWYDAASSSQIRVNGRVTVMLVIPVR